MNEVQRESPLPSALLGYLSQNDILFVVHAIAITNTGTCTQMGTERENASFLLSVIGVANTLGRIVLGFVSDRPWLNRLYTYNISLAICGLSMSNS